jgi:hypothetical protein
MKRTSSAKSKASALLSAGVMLSAGAQAMAQGTAKAAPPKPAAPAPPAAAKPAPAATGSATDSAIKYGTTFWKWKGELSAVGMLDGQAVFKTSKGEYFTVEPSTGDLKFHSAESLGFIKLNSADKLVAVKTVSWSNDRFIKFDAIKGETKVSVLGVDAQGHVVQQNSRGDKFYLGSNGDMMFVK